MPIWEPRIEGAACIRKAPAPILTKHDIPYEAEFIFNAGVAKHNGEYVMIFRNDCGATEQEYARREKGLTKTSIGIATSKNGIDNWQVKERPLVAFDFTTSPAKNVLGTPDLPRTKRLYDPRITVIDGEIYLCLAMDTDYGVRGCIARLSPDYESYEIISATAPDNRNMVLFPEKINGCYVRLERPFPVYGKGNSTKFDIWLSKSPDLKFWGESTVLLAADSVPFANDKIGPAAPPVKTKYGWLTTFHGVDIEKEGRGQTTWEHWWNKRYCAGIMLLDLEDPTRIVGMSKKPLIVPELPFEADEGFRQNVIFPGGMILEEDGEVKIYYGGADSVVCVATSTVDELAALCTEQP